MIEIKVYNSESQIVGLNRVLARKLRKVLSYAVDPKIAYFSGSRNPRRYLIDERGVFPTGLCRRVERWLLKNHLSYDKVDFRRFPRLNRPELVATLTYPPYPEQKAAAEAASASHRGFIRAPTGVGKSIIAVMIIDAIKMSTLVVVPSLELKRQLTETLSVAFGAHQVGGFSDHRLIAVENVDALDPTVPADGYDCVIIDEWHHSAAKTYQKLNKKAWKNIYFRFGLSATPVRRNKEEQILLEAIIDEGIFTIPYRTAVDNNYIVPLEAYYVPIPLSRIEAYTYAEAYTKLIVENDARNTVICDTIERLYQSNVSTLILVKQIAHGEKLVSMLEERNVWIPFANGQDGTDIWAIQKFADGKIPCLIATSIVGEGVDTKAAEYVVLAGGTGKSAVQIMQNCGRVFRKWPGKESGKVITFQESSHRWFREQHEAFCELIIKEYGVIPISLAD